MQPDNEKPAPGERAGSDSVTTTAPADDIGSVGQTRLRRVLENVIAEQGCSLKSLTVLSAQNDPFRVDTPARHRDGQWLANTAADLGLGSRKIHLRGLHYMVLGRTKPNGESYANSDEDWLWLSAHAGKAARWLGYLPFDQITDQRNAEPEIRLFRPPEPWPYISTGIDVEIPDTDDLETRIGISGFEGTQPHKLVLFGEKSSLSDVLAPLAATYGADLYLPTGEISDTLLYQMARIGAEDGRPMAVLCFSDADPAGWQMPISIARKLQAFVALGSVPVSRQDAAGNRQTGTVEFGGLDFEVHRVALTPDQVREYGLPSTPLKATEKRADRWIEAMGVAQTEIDALGSLRPDLLRRIARDAIAPYYDLTLSARVDRARTEWEEEAQDALDAQMDPGELDRIKVEADEKLAALRAEIDVINDALRIDTADLDLPPVVLPEAELGERNGTPLVDSRWSFAEQTARLIASKGYRGGV